MDRLPGGPGRVKQVHPLLGRTSNPCLHCEGWIDKLGPLLNISISLAARWAQACGLPKERQFRTDYQFSVVLSSVSQAYAFQGLTLNRNLMQRRPANSAKSLKTTRNLVEQSFAVLVLQEIVHWKWVLRHSNMAIRDWLDSNIVDTGFPVRLPHLELIRDRCSWFSTTRSSAGASLYCQGVKDLKLASCCSKACTKRSKL